MLSTETDVQRGPDSVDLKLVFSILLKNWLILTTTILLSVGIASIYLHSAKYTYTATLVVSPAESSAMDSLTSKLGSIGGLAAAAGVNLDDAAGGNSFRLYVEGLKSTDVSAQLARDSSLMQSLFSKEWDVNQKQFRQPVGPLTGLITVVKSILGFPEYPYVAPDAARLQKLLDERLVVENNSRSPVVTIRFNHEDPEFAVRFLGALDKSVDELLRQRALQRTSIYIDYLTTNLQTATMTEQRMALAQALVQQERIRIAASSDLPFAAQLFSGPSSSFRPTSPKPTLVIVLALVLGFAGGCLLILWRARSELRERAGRG